MLALVSLEMSCLMIILPDGTLGYDSISLIEYVSTAAESNADNDCLTVLDCFERF